MRESYCIVYSRRKTLALVIERNATLTVRAPRRTAVGEIAKFVKQKERWIEKSLSKQRERNARIREKLFVEGEQFLYLGILYPLLVVKSRKRQLTFLDAFLLPESKVEKAKELFASWYTLEAKSLLSKRAKELAQIMEVDYRGIKITNAKYQLGSCTSRKTLNFPWKLAMAPESIVDYVVVHELSHLKHMSHSKRFWDTVHAYYPNHREARSWLRENNHLLSL